MSEMVTVRTRKLWTCLPGKPRWIAGRQQTSAGTRKLFLADQSSHPWSAFRFALPGIPGHWHSWAKCFQGHWKEIVGPVALFISKSAYQTHMRDDTNSYQRLTIDNEANTTGSWHHRPRLQSHCNSQLLLVLVQTLHDKRIVKETKLTWG